MQYLLKLNLNETELWRLIAIDGSADRAHVARLCALSFGYPQELALSFTLSGRTFTAGTGGTPQKVEELTAFEEFKLQEGDEFSFSVQAAEELLVHTVRIMKSAEHLYCLMPSCLVGQGRVPQGLALGTTQLQAYYSEQGEQDSLDLREVTKQLRAYGAQRADLQTALRNLGAQPLQFKLLS